MRSRKELKILYVAAFLGLMVFLSCFILLGKENSISESNSCTITGCIEKMVKESK